MGMTPNPPEIDNISPSQGTVYGGTVVTLTGLNFTDVTSVKFGTTTASNFTVISDTEITVESPFHSPATVHITAINSGGTSATSSADQFTYINSPKVTGISPATGPNAGGTTVTITGSLFSEVTAVMFGTVPAASYTVDNMGQITAVSPAHANGTVDIRVVNLYGTSDISAADQFSFTSTITAVIQSSGPVAGGVPVLITGTGLAVITGVTFGGTAVPVFYIVDDSHISAITPAHAAGAVDVVLSDASSTTTGTSLYTYVANDTSTRIDVTVTDGIDDACAKATFRYDGLGVGLSDTDYGTKVVIQIPDASGTLHTVFVGQCRDSDGTFGLSDERIEMTAYDYAQFLTGQPLNDSDLSLLPVSMQTAAANTGRSLNYRNASHAFAIGQCVVGRTSLAQGVIVDIQTSTSLLTLYPASGEFVDSELLYVGDTQYAYADGHSVDVPYSTHFGTVYPETWVASVFGPASGVGATGIAAYRIVATDHTGATSTTNPLYDTDPVTGKTIAAIPKIFTSEQSKCSALKDFSLYMRRITDVKPALVSGVWIAAGYWVRMSQIDTTNYGLDLPTAATITYPCTDMVGNSIALVQTGSDQVERVHLRATSLVNSYPLDSILPATAPTGPYHEYTETVTNINTQKDLDDLCLDYYNAKSSRAKVWTCTFIQRPDLQKYQLLYLSGYGPRVPDGTYRIIRVTHTYGLAVNKTQVQFILDSAFAAKQRLGWTYQDTITEIEVIAAAIKKRDLPNEPMEWVKDNGDGTWMVKTKTGQIVITTDNSA